MRNGSPIPLVKWSQPLVLANIVPQSGGIPVAGDVTFEFETPSRKIHFAVTIVVENEAAVAITGSTWTLTPTAGQTSFINQGANPVGSMQPVINGAPLPDGYEGESGVKLWRASAHLIVQNAAASNVHARVVAGVIWEPVPSAVQMTDEERAYWFGFCNARVTLGNLTLGTGIP